MLGFAEVERGFYLRPDNLEGGVGGVRDRLRALGMTEGGSVFGASSFDSDREARVRASWDGKALTLGYTRTRLALEKWLAREPELEPDVAARESFLLGGRAIRQIVYDPLLPDPLVDVEERRAFVDTTLRMDREGRRIWARFFGAGEPKPSPRRDLDRLAH
jgi:phenylacetic acid degradation operon negative regulatory protein